MNLNRFFVAVGLSFLPAVTPLLAQPAPEPASFAAKDYATYLAALPQTLSTGQYGQISLDNVARVAIALDKTQGWDGPRGKQAHNLLRDAPGALRVLDGLHLLLQGKPEGLLQIMGDMHTNRTLLFPFYRILHDQGYDYAANAIGAVVPDMQGMRIDRLCSIPANKRPAVQAIFVQTIGDVNNRHLILQSALEMVIRPPVGMKSNPKDVWSLFMDIGQDMFTFDTAHELFEAHKTAEARELSLRMTKDSPEDERVQGVLAGLIDSCGYPEDALTILERAFKSVPEPRTRFVRQVNLRYLTRHKKTDELIRLQTGKNPLMAGEALLSIGHNVEAAREFLTVTSNKTLSTENQVAGWGGLLDADPDQALTRAKDLVASVSHLPPERRGPLVNWMARRIWQMECGEIPPPQGNIRDNSWTFHFQPLHIAPNWETRTADLAALLLNPDYS